ncbi:MAG TPA: carboxypeptidase-like regulatory domain-containing protein [Candidatus Sulfotelmatobacter sp.]|nr:carboxypeptidase-like regulatory domain-containing protein [Candidatus Sulfotelmatobacter sp.]
MRHLYASLRERNWSLALLLLLTIEFSLQVLAQSTTATGSIQGTVTDQTGAVVAGAKITITNKGTTAAVHVRSSSAGMYTSGPTLPGDYSVRIEAKGFKTADLPVTIQLGVVSRGSVKLQSGPESEVVTVQGAEVVNTQQPTVQGVLTGSWIEDLPLNGRNFMDLAQLEPGVQIQDSATFDASKNTFSAISFDGRYGRSPRFEVDGTDTSDETAGGSTQNIPTSAIQEFNLSQSSLDLSTEVTSSGAVNVTTRYGTNAIHGDAFGIFGNDKLAVKLPGSPASPFERQQFGGRVGGSLIKDKLFGFIAGERLKQDLTAAQPFSFPFQSLNARVAEPLRETQGDGRIDWISPEHGRFFYRFLFDQNSQIRPFGAASSLQVFKTENHTPSHTLGYDFSTGKYMHSIRVEYLKFHNGIVDSTGTIPAGLSNPIPGLGINIGASVAGLCSLSGGGAYCGGPSYVAPQATYQSDKQIKYDGSGVWKAHIVRYGATFNRILGGASKPSGTYPQVGTTAACLPGSVCDSPDPTAYPAQSVFLGNGIGFSTPYSSFGQPGGRLGPDNRMEAYVGDSWKAKPTLTLTYGLRYLRDTGRVDTNLGPEPTLNLWVPGLGAQVRNPNTNFAPQFGFAWDANGNGKTVIRGGAGLYYENSLWNNVLFDSPARQKKGTFSYSPQVCSQGVPSAFNWPTNPGGVGTLIAGGAGVVVAGTNQVQPTFCGGTISAVGNQIIALSDAFKVASAASAGPVDNVNYIGRTKSAANASGFDVFDPNYRTPRSWQMNLGFQHEIRPGTVLSVDYVRTVGEHFLLAVDQNHSGAARSFNLYNALAARDAAQTTQGCLPGVNQANCMVSKLGLAGAQAAYSAAGLDSNVAVTGGGPCSFCAFPGVTPYGQNNTGTGAGNGSLGALDTLEPIGRSLYSGTQVRLTHKVQRAWRFVTDANFQLAYSFSKFISQAQDQDFISLATNNDNPLQFTGPTALDRKHQVSFGGSFDLPFFTHVSVIGHFYSPLPQDLRLPELTNGGEIFATDWLGSGLGSGARPEPVPGTQIGQFMRQNDISDLHIALSDYNTHFAGNLTPAGHCLVADGQCPANGAVQVMTPADMSALGWVLPVLASSPADPKNFTWLKTMDLRVAWPFRIRDRFTIEPSASIFNVFNFSNEFQPGNLPSSSLAPGGLDGTLAPNVVGGISGSAGMNPYRANFVSGTYALGAPRQIQFGLRVEF